MRNWIAFVIELASVLSAMQLNGTMQVTHEKNLIWAQKDESTGTARLVGVNGDPEQWIPIRVASSRYITAPRSSWKFQALTFDYRQQLLLWSESGNKKLQGIYLNGSTSPFDVYSGTSSGVLGLSFDWMRGNIYWTDTMYNWIVIAAFKNTGKKDLQRVIVDTGLDQPAGIVVDPLKRQLFWSDIGVVPKIETSNLIGQNRKIIVFSDLNQPVGLTLDIDSDTLYWTDKTLNKIEAVSTDGSNRRVIVQSKEDVFYGITLYEDYLFVTEQSQKQLLVYSKSTGERDVSFGMDGAIPYDVIMYDITKQPPAQSSCRPQSCDHICTEDDVGDPVCLCAHGYVLLHDGSTCSVKSQFEAPQIIYSIGQAICSFPGNIPNMNIGTLSLDKYCFLTGEFTSALTFNVKKQLIYLYDNVTETISRLKLNGDNMKSKSPRILIEETGQIVSLSYDWIAQYFYWIDAKQGRIVAANAVGSYRVNLIERLVEPTSIAVNAINRKLYWSEKGSQPRIRVSDLDGDNIDTLIQTDIGWPDYITVDYVSYRLYWCDKAFGRIEWSSFDGKIRHQIIEQPKSHMAGLATFQDFIMWTEIGLGNGLHVGMKDSGDKIRGIVHPEVGRAGSIISFDKSSQPAVKKNPCNVTPLCEQMCFPKSDTERTCMCVLGYVLHQNGYSCTTDPYPDNFLLFSDTYKKQIFQMNLNTHQVHAIPLSSIGNPLAVALDPINKRIFWTDVDVKLLKSADIDGSNENVIGILSKDAIPDGIAVDPVTSLLYYTDGGNKIIGIFHTVAKTHLTLINRRLSKPRAIALCPESGLMFWTDWGKQSRIERAAMDGTDRKLLVNTGRGAWPNGISIDKQAKKIYWCDAKRETIEYCDFSGQNRRILMTLPKSHMFGLSVLGKDVYYTDWKKKSVMKLSTDGAKSEISPIGPEEFTRANGIVAYMKSIGSSLKRGKHKCSHSAAGRCSDFCLPTPRRKVCKCPDGVLMSADKHTCVTAKEADRWLTNSAPHIIPTQVASQTDLWKRITTNPSLLTSSLYNNGASSSHRGFQQDNRRIESNSDEKIGSIFTKEPGLENSNDKVTIVDNENNGLRTTSAELMDADPTTFSEFSIVHEDDKHMLSESNTSKQPKLDVEHGMSETFISDYESPLGENERNNEVLVDENYNEVIASITENGVSDEDTNEYSSSESPYIALETTTYLNKPLKIDTEQGVDKIKTTLENAPIIIQLSHEKITTKVNKNSTNDKINIENKKIVANEFATKHITHDKEVVATSSTDTEIKDFEVVGVNVKVNSTPKQIIKDDLTSKSVNGSLFGTVMKSKNVSFKVESTTAVLTDTRLENPGEGSTNETQILKDPVNSHVIGFLVIICSAVVVMCVLVVCAVIIYNKLIKKPKILPPRNNLNTNQTITANLQHDKFSPQLPSSRVMNNYKTHINGQIATIKIKGRKQHQQIKIANIKNGDIYSTDIAQKYATMHDSHFTGHHEDVGESIEHSPDYDMDCCSDFSFDTDIESNCGGPDFVTFRHNDDSRA